MQGTPPPKRPKIALIHPAVGCSLGGSQIFALELSQKLNKTCDVTLFSYSKVNDYCKPVFSVCRGDLAKEKNIFIRSLLRLMGKFATTPEIVIENHGIFCRQR